MGRRLKEGTKGSKVNFMTRNQALKKLQISLPEFRKLCILKGIYPREPSKAPKGKDKTYYLKKDIVFLMHDPLLEKFRDHRIWKRKLRKCKDRKEWDKVKWLREHKPRYNLSHLVKERYPSFVDALRDLDDALSTVFLFAMMPATKKIASMRATRCQELANHWNYFISSSHALRKVFVSIKGFYYQAAVQGQTITWLVPFKFTQKVTRDVDYKVMLSFLEFYEVLLGFVLFKLYSTLGLKYPPEVDTKKENQANYLEAIDAKAKKYMEEKRKEAIANESAIQQEDDPSLTEGEGEKDQKTSLTDPDLENQKRQSRARVASLKKVLGNISKMEDSQGKDTELQGADGEEEDEADETFGNSEIIRQRKQQNIYQNLFKNCHFWLSREVPKESLEFVIKSFGGKVTWEGLGSQTDSGITHEVVDRDRVVGAPTTTPAPASTMNMTREYIQPQYVYDCINARLLIPSEQYRPGSTLPPHLSPFVDDIKEGYIPEYRAKLDELYQQQYGVAPPSLALQQQQLDEDEDEDTSEEDDEVRYARDLEQEKKANKGEADDDDDDDDEAEDSEGAPVTKAKKTAAPAISKKRKRELEEKEEEADQKEVAESLIPKRKRRLLQRIKYSQRMKQDEIDKLEEKKEKIKGGKAVVTEDSTIVYA